VGKEEDESGKKGGKINHDPHRGMITLQP